jgi:MFS family permease
MDGGTRVSQSIFGVDLTPLRTSAQYRRLYLAGLVTAVGSQATYVAIPFQIARLTHSALDVGALGLFEMLPLVLCGLYGGVLADRLNRRRLIISMEASLMVLAGVLLVNALLAHLQIWILYADAFLGAAFSSLQAPSISALNQVLVPHELQRQSAALANIRGTTAMILGPSLGGLVAVTLGPAWVYGANLVTFSASLLLLVSLRDTPATPRDDAGHLDDIANGLRYARSRPDILGTYVVDLLAMALAFPVLMFPLVAARFHETYALSLLYVGIPVGAGLAVLTAGWTRRVHRYGRAIVVAASVWGLGIAFFGYVSSLWLVWLGLVVAGGADAISGIFRNTMWNESIPPSMRGRMAGMEMISYSVGPTAGPFRAGLMSLWMSLRASLTLGGLASTGSIAAVAAALPSMWHFDARTDEHVAEVRALRAGEASDSD